MSDIASKLEHLQDLIANVNESMDGKITDEAVGDVVKKFGAWLDNQSKYLSYLIAEEKKFGRLSKSVYNLWLELDRDRDLLSKSTISVNNKEFTISTFYRYELIDWQNVFFRE
jgi:hypothetical protein